MTTKFKVVTGLFVAAASLSAGLQAQEPASAPKAVPVEMYACNWRDGKGMQDLAKVNKAFNAYAAENDAGYSAWTITPQFRVAEDGFDIGWMGSWPDGEAMGASLDQNRTGKGAEILKSYMGVVDCSGGHTLMSSVAVHAPDGPPDNGVVMFSSCKVDEKSNMGAAMEAHMKTAADMRKRGAKAASWLFYPGLGMGETDFDYYWVVAMDNYSALGTAYESLLNKGGWEARQKLFAGVVSCDSPRLYDASLVRKAAAR